MTKITVKILRIYISFYLVCLFGITRVPFEIQVQRQAKAGSGSAFFDIPTSNYMGGSTPDAHDELNLKEMGRASSRCGTPTFGLRMDLPSYKEAKVKFGRGI